MRRLGRCDPTVSFTILLLALTLRLVLHAKEDTGAVLQVILPLTDVLVSAREDLRTLSFHLAVLEFTFIARLIGPDHDALALHVVQAELALVQLTRVSEIVLADAVELTVHEVSLVEAAFELETTATRLLAVDKITGELDLVIVP